MDEYKFDLYSMLKQIVEKKNQQSAIVWNGNNRVTYGEFWTMVNSILKKINEKNIRNEAIAIELHRTPILLASMFAVIASGNYYVPIDINYPIARKNYLLKNSDAKLWISDVKTESERAVNNIIYVSLEEKEICVEENRMRAPNIENIAYCIYTSGSTGNPKGVMIKEKSLLEFVVEFSKVVSVDECENVLCSTTQIFDIFFVESILALIKGKTVILTQEDEGRNPKVLLDIIEQNNVDMIQMTPSRIRMIFNSNFVGLSNMCYTDAR